jgi:hypothetical protein
VKHDFSHNLLAGDIRMSERMSFDEYGTSRDVGWLDSFSEYITPNGISRDIQLFRYIPQKRVVTKVPASNNSK